MSPYFLAGMLVGSVLIGYLYLSTRKYASSLDEDKQQLLNEKHLAVEFMHGLVDGMGHGMSRQLLFEKIAHAAVISTNASSACVFERVDNTLKAVALEGLFPPQRVLNRPLPNENSRAQFIASILKSEIFEIGEGLIGSVAQTQKPVLIEIASQDSRVVQHEDPALHVHSIIIVPICFREKLLGVLAIANPISDYSFHKTDFSLMQSLADQAGMAIYNADYMSLQIEKNKIDFDLNLASSVQGMLLPATFPADVPLAIDACYQPAQQIGGDLYDVFALDAHKIALAVADVSGKGVAAALLMAICHTHLRHYANANTSPAATLRAMNEAMHTQMRNQMFITMLYAIIDTQANTLTLARAGHEPPVFLSMEPQGCMITPLMPEGMALGMVPPSIFDVTIEDITVPFKAGDTLLFYTDGVTEVTNEAGECFGLARLQESLKRLISQTPTNINQTLLAHIRDFTPTPPSDDLTLLTIKATTRPA